MADIEADSNVLKQDRQIDSNVWREAERREMAPLGIGFDGRYYRYKEYRYDRCSDAVNYARLGHSSPSYQIETDDLPPQWLEPKKPDKAEQRLMVKLAMTFDGKYYRYRDYHYERFIDAIHYAQLTRLTGVI